MSLSTTDSLAAERTRAGGRLVERAVRVCVSLGLLYATYLVTTQAISVWHFRRGSPEEIEKAIKWDPGNARFYAARAQALRMSVEGADVNEVIRLNQTATRLSPYKAWYWAELASSYEWAGREEQAQRAYERAGQLFPNSPEINWKLGNYYIRAGKSGEALRAIRKMLLGSAQNRQAAYDLAWRAEIPAGQILGEMVPGDTGNLLAYLGYLVRTGRMDQAGETWARLLGSGARLEPQAAFFYLDALIQHKRVDELSAAWGNLAAGRPAVNQSRRPEANRITNGGFEDEILNGGLDWRVLVVEGVVVSVDNLNSFDGTRSLRILFEGQRNIEYVHVSQYVPVQPDSRYRFTAYLRTQKITTDSGPRFEIFDAFDARRMAVATDSVEGTQSWTPQQIEFRTSPETRLLVVRLVRSPSRKFDNLISGTVWIDHVSLVPIESR